jgi:hypothetical protein
MKYVLLIHDDEAAMGSNENTEARAAMYQDYEKFSNGLVERGLMRGGEELQPTSTATTVRMKDGAILTTDGPFAETKEQLGGFFLIECENLDQAIEAASEIPSVKYGGVVEVRPVVEPHD